MSAAQLMVDLTQLGIHIMADGDRLRYLPRSAVTPDLAARIKSHKDVMLEILHQNPEISALDMIESLRAAAIQWVQDPEAGEMDEEIEVIDPPDPCPKCGTLELWQSLTGNWHCSRCEPPTTTRRFQERPVQLKIDRTKYPQINTRGPP